MHVENVFFYLRFVSGVLRFAPRCDDGNTFVDVPSPPTYCLVPYFDDGNLLQVDNICSFIQMKGLIVSAPLVCSSQKKKYECK